MIEHRIEIALAGRRYVATYQGETIGEWRSPETEAARWLKAHGAADNDTLVTTRNGRPAMRGLIGWLSSRTVIENEKFGPRWAKWTPFGDRPAPRQGFVQDALSPPPDPIGLLTSPTVLGRHRYHFTGIPPAIPAAMRGYLEST